MSDSFEQDVETFFPKEVKVQIYDKDKRKLNEYSIAEFTFGNRIVFLKFIKDFFSDLSKNKDIINKTEAEIVSEMIDVAGDKLGTIYSLVLGENIEWIRTNLTLKNEVQVLTAIIEVNDIPFLIAQIQKLIAARK